MQPLWEREVVQTVVPQVGVKDNDLRKTPLARLVNPSNPTKATYEVCVLGDAQQYDKEKVKNIHNFDIEWKRGFEDKTLVKKHSRKKNLFRASTTVWAKLQPIIYTGMKAVGK